MHTPAWLKPGIYGAILGAVGLSIIGFSWGGWVTQGTAARMAASQASTDVVAALTGICVDQSRRDPALAQKLADLKATAIYKQADFVMSTGWATMPGQTEGNRDVAKMCVGKLGA